MRKWASNSQALLADLESENHGLACAKEFNPNENLKILGIRWNPHFDSFFVAISLPDKIPNTKRNILSIIAKLYDPLGWVTPATVTAKIFMQQLWREELGWDDAIPASLANKWHRIYSKLAVLNRFQLNPWISLGPDADKTELHGFADACNVAYAAVVYLRITSRSGEISVNIIAAKSKVAPLKPLSVPRLELSAAVLLAKLLAFVRDSLGLTSTPYTCWTDSTVVLALLNQHPSRWKTFVANRTAEIHSKLPSADWYHVPTTENPADCASRSILCDELLSHLRYGGPDLHGCSRTLLHGPPLSSLPPLRLIAKLKK